MPRERRSIEITDTYRDRLRVLRARVDRAARAGWARITIDNLQADHDQWAAQIGAVVAAAQFAGVRLTSAYLAAYMASELQRPQEPPAVDAGTVGAAPDGRPVDDLLASSLIGVRVALKDGAPPSVALDRGMARAARAVGESVMHAPREALAAQIRADDRIVGWHRVTSGGCLACVASATRPYGDSEPLDVHPGCNCSAEPVIRDVPQTVPRATGADVFDALAPAEQDARYGPAAELVRSGQVPLRDMVDRSPMATQADQITQAPVSALT